MMPPKKICLSVILMLGVAAGLGFRPWNRSSLPLSNETLTDLKTHPQDPLKLLATSEKGLYLREGKGNWKRILFLEEKSAAPKRLVAHPRLEGKVLLLTGQGVLEANLKNGRSRWLFREKNPSKNRVHALALHPDDPRRIYLGTERGLFQSPDGGRSWSGPLGWPENESIRFVGFLPSPAPVFLLGTTRELFFSKDEGDSFESGFSLPLFSEEDFEEGGVPSFNALAYSSKDPSRVWVGTEKGVFESPDGGTSWQKLSERGLRDQNISNLVFSERSGLVAATAREVVRFHPSEKRWETLSAGLTRSPRSLALRSLPGNDGEMLLIASGNEVLEQILKPFETPPPEPPFIPSPERKELFQKLIALEPSAREVQKRAIRYGNLGNGKIQRWQGGSRLRALIPSLSFGKKLSFNNNIDVDRGGTNNPDVFILGPDKVDKGWDLGLRWDLGDFIYSDSQTAIDLRQKSNVELRESILSEVTRIYFERRRVQMEIVFSPPESPQEYFDLLLRLDELTSQTDALTDGFFSRELKKIEQNHPELAELWQSAV